MGVEETGGRNVSGSRGRAGEGSLAEEKGADLRKFLVQIMERHLDKKLVTAHSLERIE